MIRLLILMVILNSCERFENVSNYNLKEFQLKEGKLFFKGKLFSGKLKKVEKNTVKLIEYKNGLEDGRYLEIFKNGSVVKDVVYAKGKLKQKSQLL